MSSAIRCAVCGEEEALRGERRGDEILVHCQRCGYVGPRAPIRACPTCGRTDLYAAREEVREKVRGSQESVVGMRTVYRCPTCQP